MLAKMAGSGLIGQTISHYRILEKLGGGGMGVVYKAEDTQLGRLVALKFLSEPLVGDAAALQRFQREARMASALDHPNICTIYEIGEHAGLPFIAMQYLEGQTLEQRIADKALPINQVVEMGIQIADALEAAHAMGIIHRDIKPANIYVTKRRDQPKILDFGVAKLTRELRAGVSEASVKVPTTVDALSTMPGAQIGTFAYMSPEQERGEDLDRRSDLFSFGLVLYDMATGWRSFSDKVAAVIHDAVGSQEPMVRSATTLPVGLGDIISKATQVDRDRRYQSAAEMSTDLRRLKRELDSTTGPPVGTIGPFLATNRPAGDTEPPAVRPARRPQLVERRAAIKLYLERFFLALLAGLVTTLIMAMLTAKITVFAGIVAIGSIAVLAFLAMLVADELTRETESGPDAAVSVLPVAQKKRGILGWKLALSAGVVAIAIPAGVFFFAHRSSALTDKDTIVLGGFSNTTGDPVFDDALRRGLAVQLEQSPFLSLVSDRRIQQTLALMGQGADARLTPEITREICERTASAAVLDGSIASLGTQYVLGLRAKNCQTGQVLAEEQVQVARKEEVLNSLTQIASQLRTRLGESLTTVQRHDTPLAEATTPSLEALKAYSLGTKVNFSSGSAAAIPFFQRAIEIDPNFAMAYAHLGLLQSAAGETVLSMANTQKAYELREHASDRERFFITVNYDRSVTGNLEKARETLELWARTYPRDADAHGILSGFSTQGTGRLEESIAEANTTIELEPDHAYGYVNKAYAYFLLDRFPEAEATLRKAAEQKVDMPELALFRYYVAFLNDDRAAMQREAAQAQGKPGTEDWMVHSESLVLARSGQLQKAADVSRHAVDLAQRVNERERAATYIAGVAAWQALFGNVSQARRNATEALELSKGRDIEYVAAFTLALLKDSDRSLSLMRDLEHRFPEDTSVQFNYLPALRALEALNHSKPSKALEFLQAASPYELAVPGVHFFGFFGSFYPVYIRAQAYLDLHQGAEAGQEFQKILRHRGLAAADPVGALAQLGLARSYALQGDTAKAKAAYQDFLTLWKQADPEISILKQAKVDYAKLQ